MRWGSHIRPKDAMLYIYRSIDDPAHRVYFRNAVLYGHGILTTRPCAYPYAWAWETAADPD